MPLPEGEDIDWVALGDRLAGEQRRRLGITHDQFASKARVSKVTWYKLRTGQTVPTDDTLIKVARALRLPESEVMSWAGRNYEGPLASNPVGLIAFEEFMDGDEALSPAARRVLVELYRLITPINLRPPDFAHLVGESAVVGGDGVAVEAENGLWGVRHPGSDVHG